MAQPRAMEYLAMFAHRRMLGELLGERKMRQPKLRTFDVTCRMRIAQAYIRDVDRVPDLELER
jgi:hypothetical protein